MFKQVVSGPCRVCSQPCRSKSYGKGKASESSHYLRNICFLLTLGISAKHSRKQGGSVRRRERLHWHRGYPRYFGQSLTTCDDEQAVVAAGQQIPDLVRTRGVVQND